MKNKTAMHLDRVDISSFASIDWFPYYRTLKQRISEMGPKPPNAERMSSSEK